VADVELIGIDDVRQAAQRIEGKVVRTPLVPTLWDRTDRPLWLKPENLQVIGAFKARGALNAIGALPDGVRARGIVTHSSGNHGQAVAYAARAFGVKATVVMPDASPRVKMEAVRALGAEVVVVPGKLRESTSSALAEEHGYTLVPPYDHDDVIAGQGTIGLEIAADLPSVATVLAPIGGGGLVSGVATAIKELLPTARVIGVEPELAADAEESLRLGRLVEWPIEQRYRTIADGVRTGICERTFAHLQARVDDVLTVSEDAIREAMGVLARQSRIVAEPSGALAVAAYRTHAEALPPGPVVAVISGGNLEPDLLASVLVS
jgi:threonine dehydratase